MLIFFLKRIGERCTSKSGVPAMQRAVDRGFLPEGTGHLVPESEDHAGDPQAPRGSEPVNALALPVVSSSYSFESKCSSPCPKRCIARPLSFKVLPEAVSPISL